MPIDILSELSNHGYAELCEILSIEEAVAATSMLGEIIPLNGQVNQKLIPLTRDVATSPSFSKRYGYEAFPLHTDTVFWMKPARFAVFFMESASRTATRVLESQDTEKLINIARRNNPIFIRQTIGGPIYSRPWSEENGGCVIYDPCYMQPENRAAKDFEGAAHNISARAKRIIWSGAKALIIDNWRVLHGREICNDDNRVLFRFYRGGVNELGA